MESTHKQNFLLFFDYFGIVNTFSVQQWKLSKYVCFECLINQCFKYYLSVHTNVACKNACKFNYGLQFAPELFKEQEHWKFLRQKLRFFLLKIIPFIVFEDLFSSCNFDKNNNRINTYQIRKQRSEFGSFNTPNLKFSSKMLPLRHESKTCQVDHSCQKLLNLKNLEVNWITEDLVFVSQYA